ncbi:WD40 repeat domain-containing protein [Pseudofrankia sp. BMG5.37]|uniref:WD40 repeat domain-containing protein n=1 Tax=Pseudofrankia sp. BMG5.37 TaxID=3050035 RepID=UPI0028941854|nr:WD40 repeat domain-containing protein [Pseudofrankia sp. BMG5.37]MDT3445595.1 WD40 repeat domain-containing protein [Pseudofrankia sp. BMG5.37]
MSVFPDPGASRAVLIGTSHYTIPALEDLPAVAANLDGLSEVLRSSGVWGLSARHCVVVPDPATPQELIEPIIQAASEATDTLLVYYAGHGLLAGLAAELHLALTTSKPNASYTAVSYELVREELLKARADRLIVILDCCYSGRALGRMSGSDPATVMADGAIIEGTYLIAAAAETKTAISIPGEPHTAFTAELLALLKQGVQGEGPYVDLDTLYQEIRASLRAKQRPLPQIRVRNTIDRLAFRNRAFNADRISLADAPLVGASQDVQQTPTETAAVQPVTPGAAGPGLPAVPAGQPHSYLNVAATDDKPTYPASVVAGFATAFTAATSPQSVRIALAGYGAQIGPVALSPDGATLAGYSSKPLRIHLWDVASGELVVTIKDLRLGIGVWTGTRVSLLVFSPDGRTLATCGTGGIQLWDTFTGRRITALKPEWPIHAMAFSPDGRTLATVSQGALVTPNGDKITQVELQPRMTLGRGLNDEIQMWDVGARRSIASLNRDTAIITDTGNVTTVAYAPDGVTLATGRWDGTIQLRDTTTLRLTTTLAGHTSPVGALAFSPNGQTLASGGRNRDYALSMPSLHGNGAEEAQSVRLWDLASGQLRGHPLAGHTNSAGVVAFSPDSQILAAAGTMPNAFSTHLWDTATGQRITTLRPTAAHIRAMAFSPDGKTIITVTGDGFTHGIKIEK